MSTAPTFSTTILLASKTCHSSFKEASCSCHLNSLPPSPPMKLMRGLPQVFGDVGFLRPDPTSVWISTVGGRTLRPGALSMTSAMLCFCFLPRLPKVVLAENKEPLTYLFHVTTRLTRGRAPRIALKILRSTALEIHTRACRCLESFKIDHFKQFSWPIQPTSWDGPF